MQMSAYAATAPAVLEIVCTPG